AVWITGTSLGGVTDLDGKYEINVKTGTYTISASYISYHPSVQSVKVGEGITPLNFQLEENAIGMSGVVVTAKRKTASDIATLSSVKQSLQIVSGMSSQQISRSLDRDASQVVKRIPGISIVDNRFIVVRGLNQRYNNVWLNNAATPSSETDQKAFSFDLLPSKMLDNIMIYKTAAPELSAEATGGFIKIYTKNMPDNDFIELEIGSSIKEGTTFKTTQQISGGTLDFLGFDDGSRAIPKNFPSNLNSLERAQVDALSTELNTHWLAKPSQAFPDAKIQFNIGKKWNFSPGFSMGSISSINYAYDFNTKNKVQTNSYESYDFSENKAVYDKEYTLNTYSTQANINLLSNWAFRIGHKHQIEFKNLFTQVGQNTSSLIEGYNNYRSAWFKYQNHLFSARSVYSGQLSGAHELNDQGKSKMDWNFSYSYANRREPDRRIWGQKRNESTGEYEYLIPSASSINELGRLWLENKEHLFSGAINYIYKFNLGSYESTLKAGGYGEYKYRNYSERSLCYQRSITGNITDAELNAQDFESLFTNTYLGQNKAFYLKEETGFENLYRAQAKQISAYLAWDVPLTKGLNLYFGLRGEFSQIQLHGYSDAVTPVYVNNPKFDLFPSANLSYRFNDKNVFRIAYGYTVNRAEFRELAPLKYYDFSELATYFGNPKLKNAYIHNIDLRYEYYPHNNETISLALFYKNFTNPIEMVHIVSSGENFSFDNAQSARVLGIEFELKKSLDFMAMKDFGMQLNAAYIYSQVKFSNQSNEKNRSLQGQSPYLINAGLYYANDKIGLSASILYNVIGKRMLAAGTLNINGEQSSPDVYEKARNVLDFVLTQQIGKHLQFKFGVKDILNQAYRTTQTFEDILDGKKVFKELDTRYYRPGRTYSLSLTVKF
ncbi:MAG: TonB-dependent receptor, partial [Bacteroidales bacterium]